jgi:ribosomal protein S25
MVQGELTLKKRTQEDEVYNIVKELQPIRTETIKINAMYLGISCADRRLRELQEKGLVKSYKLPHDKTKTWETI